MIKIIYREGSLYNPVTNDVKDVKRLEEFDSKNYTKFKRFELSGLYDKIVKDKAEIED